MLLVLLGDADAVVFGKFFLANPDLPARFQKKAPLNDIQWQFAYKGGAQGYTDYPTLEQAHAQL